MSFNKKLIISAISLMMITGGALYSQESSSGTESQKAKELDEFEKSLDAKIAFINKKLSSYTDLQNLEVTHSPVQSRFRKGDGYIELEKYDFLYEAPNSTTVVGGKTKTVRIYYSGQDVSKVESTIIEENYKLRTKRLFRVTDPSPLTEDLGDVEVFRQLNNEAPVEFKLSEMLNTISNPNRIQFKKEFYLGFLNNLEEDLRYTRKYVDLYGTNSHVKTIEELKKSVNY